jgi:hypothetical protein
VSDCRAEDPVPFVAGLELSRALYGAAQPILARRFPDLAYGAGRLEAGSEVLGFDTSRSTDHDWGPRLTLFLPEDVFSEALAADVRHVLAQELPFEVCGVPTHFRDGLVSRTATRPIDHGVAVATLRGVFAGWLGLDHGPEAPLRLEEWLVMPEQQLRAFTSGAVFRDDSGDLARARAMLRWYPHDVWLYLLAAAWLRVEQEEAFMGRCGEVGDDLGSRIVAARLVRELMHLSFLMEQQYAPYSKWFGSAFARLACAPRLLPSLRATLAADRWPEREEQLCRAYELVAALHNGLGLTPYIVPRVSSFHGRPYRVVQGGRFWQALRAAITVPEVKRLVGEQHAIIGSTSQWADSTDVLSRRWDAPLRALYRSAFDE